MGNQTSTSTNVSDDDQVVNREARAAYMFIPPLLHTALEHVHGSDVDWDAVGRMAVSRKYLLAYTDESYMNNPESFASIEFIASQNQPIDSDLMQTFLRVASGNVRMFPEEADADSTHVAALIRKYGVRGVAFAKKLAVDVLDDKKAEDIIMMIGKDFTPNLPREKDTDVDEDETGGIFITEVPLDMGVLPSEVDERVESALNEELSEAKETIETMKAQMRRLRFNLEACEEERGNEDEVYERLREEADNAERKREQAESMIEYAQRESREMQDIVAGTRERMRSLTAEVEMLREELAKKEGKEMEEAKRRIAKAESDAEAAFAEETRLRKELGVYIDTMAKQDREILDLKGKVAEEQRASERLMEENTALTQSFAEERVRFEEEFRKAHECGEKEKDTARELRKAREDATKALRALDEEIAAREKAETKSKEMEERALSSEKEASQLAGLRAKVEETESANRELRGEVARAIEKISEVDKTKELEKTQEELRVQTEQLRELQLERQEFELQKERLQSQITDLEEEITELKIGNVHAPVEGENSLQEKMEMLELEVKGLRTLLSDWVDEQF